MFASLVGEALMGLGCVTFSFALMGFAAFLLALRSGLLPGVAEKLNRVWAAAPPIEGGEGGLMTFDPEHAEDVALPSACVMVEELFPQASGPGRDQLVYRVATFLMTTLSAYCEFLPPSAVPAPSAN